MSAPFASLSTQLLTVALLTLQRQLDHNQVDNFPLTTSSPQPEVFDYIIVGGGTAGSIVAGRLAENTSASVLLLEAGGPTLVTREMTGVVDFTSSDIWPYSITQQQKASLAYSQLPLPYGKSFGGTSTISFNFYNRGNSLGYDSWSTDFGANGWSSTKVFPYFRKPENNSDLKLVRANPNSHNTKGPVEVSTISNPDPFLLQWRSILKEAGWPLVDFGALKEPSTQYGVGIPQVTQSKTTWVRSTTSTAYVESVVCKGRNNLKIRLNSHVTKVFFTGKLAVGVEFVHLNQTYRVLARQEVILSAGTFGSPQLLMLSGVGPAQHLNKLNIPIVANLPVGSTLVSHPNAYFDFTLSNGSLVNQAPDITVKNLYRFLTTGNGPLRQLPVVMFYLSSGITGSLLWPDVLAYTGGPQWTYGSRSSSMLPLNFYKPEERDAWKKYLGQFTPDNVVHTWTNFLNVRPLSVGSVRLASADPFQLPLIDPGFFTNDQDLAGIVQAMSTAFKIFELPESQKLFTYSALPVPGCTFCADGRPLSMCTSYLACVAKTVTFSDGHDCCTVRMGGGRNFNSSYVLDERLRVRTLRKLRIIDASVMPAIPNGNIMAAVMMIAEKGAQLVKEDNQ